jgi:hypothetical protein
MSFYVSGTALGGFIGRISAGILAGAFWALGKWPACVAFIVAMQAAALAIALAGWRTPRPTQANL